MKKKILLLISCLLFSSLITDRNYVSNEFNKKLLLDGNCTNGKYVKISENPVYAVEIEKTDYHICGKETDDNLRSKCVDSSTCRTNIENMYICDVFDAEYQCLNNNSGNSNSSETNNAWNNPTDGINTNNCSSLGNFKGDLENIFKAFKIVAPILTLALSSFEFLSAITSKQAEGLKGATKKFTTRLVLVVVLYFLPVILNLILDLVFPGASTCIS